MSTAQRDKDEKFMHDAKILVEGLAAVRRRVDEARSAWLRADHARLRAIVDKRPPEFVASRVTAANDARQALRAVEKYYADSLEGNAAYLRKEALNG